MSARLARILRRWADRLDPAGTVRQVTGWSYTYEPYKGLVWHPDERGCLVWYRTGDLDRAYQGAEQR